MKHGILERAGDALPKRAHIYRPFALTMFLFGLLVWLYVVAIQITNPCWLSGPFSHIPFPPFNWRLDEVGMIAFAVSAFGFFVWQLEESEMKR
jgi:hypothetical protein